ncbi:hypothetical protein PPSIR1_37889 [Plesiocystis pacifica SIR-1]|uniref:DUF1553 domain-containing protein n=1 Tax=Plesiocystis pacifica SIR-1 TaxID=391625 RepID=A6G9L7_9BACT|nr:DUF1553 domain-containing protein [Plesiocystis pacifica]EDM77411.1 hypothetical protein PPSIR1_37889 [Plesiocystis pacifica SIR-1]
MSDAPASSLRRPWVKDALFVGLCVVGLAGLVVGFALPSDAGARGQDTRARLGAAPSQRGELAAVAAEVDAALAADHRALGLEPSVRAPTLLVARRLSLALTGTIPSLEEVRALELLRDDEGLDEGEVLARWTRYLLTDRRHAEYFAERFARAFVGVEQGPLIAYRRRRFVAWLADTLADGWPWDVVVTSLLTSSGLWTQHPAANFVTAALVPETQAPDEEVLAGRVSRALLGVRLDCAQCHDHPFDERWSQTDFQGLAAFFGRSELSLRGVQDTRGVYVYDDHERQAPTELEPGVPFAPELLPAREQVPSDRARLAAWITHPDNPAFARATVNRVWALMFGRGLVEPVDDLPIDASVPPALERLAKDFIEHDYDLRRLIAIIAASETFARASYGPTGGADEAELDARTSSWAQFPLTRLRPEQVVGALLQAAKLETLDHESHVLVRFVRDQEQLAFVERYGDAGAAELEASLGGGTIPQRLLLLNGELVHERTRDNLVANAATRIAALTRLDDDDARAVEVAYLAVLTRRPSAAEAAHFEAKLAGLAGEPRRQALADLYWVLLNTTEFAWNH